MQLCLDSHVEVLTSSNNCGSSCQHGTSAGDLRVWPLIYRGADSVAQHMGAGTLAAVHCLTLQDLC